MTLWRGIPDDWTSLPPRLMKSPNIALLITANVVEIRGEGEHAVWRRRPIAEEAGYRNKNGTYNGANLFADITGLSRDEITWTAHRLHHLLNVEKKSKAEAKSIVASECKNAPWMNGNG